MHYHSFPRSKRKSCTAGTTRPKRILMRGIQRYILFYNTERPHSTLHYLTPEKKEQEFWKQKREPSDEWESPVRKSSGFSFCKEVFAVSLFRVSFHFEEAKAQKPLNFTAF